MRCSAAMVHKRDHLAQIGCMAAYAADHRLPARHFATLWQDDSPQPRRDGDCRMRVRHISRLALVPREEYTTAGMASKADETRSGRATSFLRFRQAAIPQLEFRILGRILLHAALVGLAAGLLGSMFFVALEFVQ